MYILDITDRIFPREIDIARTIKETPVLYINGVQYQQIKYGVFKQVNENETRER